MSPGRSRLIFFGKQEQTGRVYDEGYGALYLFPQLRREHETAGAAYDGLYGLHDQVLFLGQLPPVSP